MSNPLVSILIPVYNREFCIGRSIESAINQSYGNIEIIVVDNASSDNTFDVCRSYAESDSRVKLYRNEKNIGPVLNWKRCLEYASGEFTKIVFSDDLIHVNCIEKMLPKLLDKKCGFVYSAVSIGESIDNSTLSYQLKSDKTVSRSMFIKLLISGMAPVSPGAFLFRSQDIKKNLLTNIPSSTSRNYIEHGAGPDVMISLLTIQDYQYVSFISQSLIFFRAHKSSITVSDTNNRVLDAYDSAISFYLKNNQYNFSWVYYLTHAWLLRGRTNKGWKNPRAFIMQNEGKGSYFELVQFLMTFVIYTIPIKLINKLFLQR